MADVLNRNQIFDSPQDALLHSGVKGMRWGVRKEDKGSGSTRASVKADKVATLRARAINAEVAAREHDTRAESRSKSIGGRYMANNDRQMAVNNRAHRDALNKTADAVESGHLTPQQKKLLIGGAVAGGLLLAAYGSTKMQSGEVNSMMLRGQAALRGKPFDFNKNEAYAKAKTPKDVLEQVVPGINPAYKQPGGQMNCRRCTFAYELRRRGYDVNATASAVGYGQSESGLINALTPGKRNVSRSTSLASMVVKGAKGIRTQVEGDSRTNPATTMTAVHAGHDRKSLLAALEKQPAGARGEAVFNFGAFGHSLSYERFGDKTYIFDNQKGTRYSMHSDAQYKEFLDKWSFGGGIKNVEITRLDNVELDHKFLSRWATNNK